MPGTGRTIVFLSDFGYRNEWVGICHAVINRIAPGSPIVDLSHGVPPLDVRNGALLLVDSLPYLAPTRSCSRSSTRASGATATWRSRRGRPARGRARQRPARARAAALGGVRRAVEITSPGVVLTPVSPSFHARDVLAPAAAYLAAGAALDTLGPAVDPATLAQMTIPEPTVERGKIECEVLDLNRFGNVLLNVREADLAASGLGEDGAVQIDATSGSARAQRVSTYGDVESGEWGLIVDPRGWALVIRGNPANAAGGPRRRRAGRPVWLTTARD